MEYTLWCDESAKFGDYYSNFYGGALVKSNDSQHICNILRDKKNSLNFHNEVKWNRVTENYLEKYKDLISVFFSFMEQDMIKIRIMFTQNALVPNGLTKEQREQTFFILYYHFLKFAFGFTKVQHPENSKLKILFDWLPDKKEKNEAFKNFVYNIKTFTEPHNLTILRDGIGEVDSKKHDILQCLDIVLGAMFFRLNNLHRAIPEGQRRRGRRTIAKESLYKHILHEIKKLYGGYNFNIGDSTGMLHGDYSAWSMPFRHWKFVPTNHTFDPTKTK
ncbi:DUF3800 domain-containing protein [Nitratidesulfovibrio liaohensis]|uniref:DUF3800 domain-containing protein n=1 Tax=Nitratidesulfovibrio liaohensis TaxID=2604158 RepID=A0ABY9QZ65_9BACT|nr:DUF3800 domain-containing protein [Nitratidesulfovibrio liaohensis]WMW64489.1 DUF3800 domain-containing protein [Nitratidesulfovibrio liaohensis]